MSNEDVSFEIKTQTLFALMSLVVLDAIDTGKGVEFDQALLDKLEAQELTGVLTVTEDTIVSSLGDFKSQIHKTCYDYWRAEVKPSLLHLNAAWSDVGLLQQNIIVRATQTDLVFVSLTDRKDDFVQLSLSECDALFMQVCTIFKGDITALFDAINQLLSFDEDLFQIVEYIMSDLIECYTYAAITAACDRVKNSPEVK